MAEELKYLDNTGLETFKGKLVDLIPTKVSQLENDSGYVTGVTGVSFSQTLTSGTEIGVMTINNVSTPMYAPEYSIATAAEIDDLF